MAATGASDIIKQIVSDCNIRGMLVDETTFLRCLFLIQELQKMLLSCILKEIMADQTCPSIELRAVDEESSTGTSIWLPASDVSSRIIASTSRTLKKLIW